MHVTEGCEYYHVVAMKPTENIHRVETRLASTTDQTSQNLQTLQLIYEGTASAIGDEFFRALVRSVAVAMNVNYAFIAEFADSKQRVRTLSYWEVDHVAENIEFDLQGTPCEAVLGGDMKFYPDHLPQLFPNDTGLLMLNARSYLAIPLIHQNGEVLGHLAIFDDRPMKYSRDELSVFYIFGARATAELARRQIEIRLQESEQRFRDLYEEAPVVYLAVGAKRKIENANRRATELFGYEQDKLIGRDLTDLVADTTEAGLALKNAFEQFLSGTETRHQEIEMRNARGQTLWMSLSMRPIRNQAGAVVATRSTLEDFTARKRVEEALQKSEQKLANILETAMDAIITIDHKHCVTLFNHAAEQVFRCSAQWAKGQPFDRFLSRQFRNVLDSYVKPEARIVQSRQQMWAPEGLTALRADGEEFPIEATISPLDIDGNLFYTIILRDVNERAEAERSLHKLRRENINLHEEIKRRDTFAELIGDSPVMQVIYDSIGVLANTDTTVLINGETGTGKELVAKTLHNAGSRKDKMLVVVNCAALPSELIESELFGHEKGAFTGATVQRKGRFELADGGTIFLDEVGELSAQAQAKLLRALQEQAIERVGGGVSIKVNVRVIAATHRDLSQMVTDGTFRDDLFYRLNVFPIRVPSLRERTEDIPDLADYFLEKFSRKFAKQLAGISRESMESLQRYSWPGNVRELQNVIERAAILSPGPVIEIHDPMIIKSCNVTKIADAQTLENVERLHIQSVLEGQNWVIEGPQGAATILGLKPSTLRFRMHKLGITKPKQIA